MSDGYPIRRNRAFSWTGVAFFMGKLAIAVAAVAWLYSRNLLDLTVLEGVSFSRDTVLLLFGGCASMFFAVFLLAHLHAHPPVFRRFSQFQWL